MEDLRVLVFFYIIEGALVGYTGMALIGIRLNLKQTVMVGLLQGLLVYLVRGIYTINQWPLGTHTVLNLLGLIIILRLVGRRNWGASAVAGLVGFIILILSESATFPFILSKLNITIEDIMSNTWLHIVTGYLGDALLILACLFTAFTGRALINIEHLGR